ncbi:hypothetical protein OJAV_G00209250 [Oryzias javanicus]|uniref:FAM171 C-terminal domain-containing protein n=1 Tax=Oryzias javanicus TaxID=123683 RepID=A0A3S2P695_ORYJA|nr:hypothetical protein OJAV_G00209250 [Oryzias javanicus]
MGEEFPRAQSVNSGGGGMATPIIGSAADRLTWRESRRLRVLAESRAQCSHVTGDANASWACCSPRHEAQAEWVSAPAILFPHVHALDGGLTVSMVRTGLGSILLSSDKNGSFRRQLGEEKALKLTVVRKKDQSTSTSCDEASSGHVYPQQQQNIQQTERQENQNDASFIPVNDSSVIRNPAAVVVTVDCDDVERDANLRDRTVFLSEQVQTAASLVESLFFYNQPVAILPAPGFLHVEERSQMSKSATLPRAGAGAVELRSKDGLPTSLPKNQTEEAKDQPGASEDANPRSPFPESASVPGTLSKIGQSRKSGDTAAGFSKHPSPQLPRAWFVSLEGKPAAEIHHATAEQQRRRRPAQSRDTSLDSGVDMSELNAAPVRRAGTLERRATFVKRTSQQ